MQNQDKSILILNRSFWPDIEATGQFLTELSEELVKKYKITVIAGRSYYMEKETFRPLSLYTKETFNGINIIRVRHTKFWKGHLLGRFINWFTYGMFAFGVALMVKSKMIIACTDPPFLGILAMIISRLKGIPLIYNCRDLYPDVALELGKLKPGLISHLFDNLNKKALYTANLVVPLGISMENRLKVKGILKERIKVIPDFVDTSKIKPVSKKDNPLLKKFGLEDRFILMHSGNIGLSQDFNSILQSLAMMEECSLICLVFIGEGSGKGSLKNKIQLLGLKNVLFLPYQLQDLLSFSLGMADLHLITLRKGLSGTVVPSKLYGIMAAGKPYLAITDKGSEPAIFVREYECGFWASPGDTEAIRGVLKWALGHPAELEKMGQIARRIAEARFDKNVIIKEWFRVLANFDEKII